MLKVHFFQDVSEKFSYCFSCQTKDQGHFYYSRMWRVSIWDPTYVYTVGNLCVYCVEVLHKTELMVPNHIPQVQVEQFIKTFISKKVYIRKGKKDVRKAGAILPRM